ncbi:MAG: hypothetical protein A2Y73_01930 [Chloroflexi bacterium RBG_13_56_8]|nr:MAG: hypothetical protein A2Y73_01930 [Chloroflexi bacterium RBG_13_56_8]
MNQRRETAQAATNFVVVGVGGQGILLAADVLALVGMRIGLDVKKAEVHGMAQRGGSVISHVRWGEHVMSPLISAGEVDHLLAFERLEALRYAEMLRPGGTLLINDYRIAPISVSSGNDIYPSDADEEKAYASATVHRYCIQAMEMARELGQVRVNNVVMLGTLSAFLDVPEDVWLEVISSRVPERYGEINRKAFALGRTHTLGLL